MEKKNFKVLEKKFNLINKAYYNYMQNVDLGIINYPTIKPTLHQKLTKFSIYTINKILNNIITLTPNQITNYLNTI